MNDCPEPIRVIAEQAARAHAAQDPTFNVPRCFLAGVNWLWKILSMSTPAFDESALEDQVREISHDLTASHYFSRGARWQHARDARHNLIVRTQWKMTEAEAIKLGLECDRLRASLTTRTEERIIIEKLRQELVEAKGIVEAGCYIGSFNVDQQLGLQERCEKFLKQVPKPQTERNP